jgi:hypothetical protein
MSEGFREKFVHIVAKTIVTVQDVVEDIKEEVKELSAKDVDTKNDETKASEQ